MVIVFYFKNLVEIDTFCLMMCLNKAAFLYAIVNADSWLEQPIPWVFLARCNQK